MSLQIASLNSGSNANCYYIGNNKEAVLIDAGLSCRETEKRMKRLGLDLSRVKAIFISHEHDDHIAGLPVLSKKYQMPVYITSNTLHNCRFGLNKELVYSFNHSAPVSIGDLSVIPFIKSHDANDPHSFIVSGNSVNIGVITDIGYACKHVIRRISGRKGHLSNDQALELFLKHKPKDLQLLILSHLSQNNNHPDIVSKLFSPHAKGIKVVIASRYRESELFSVERNYIVSAAKPIRKLKDNKAQLSLFDPIDIGF